MAGELSEAELNTWLRPLQANIEANTLVLSAANEHAVTLVQNRFKKRICEIVNRLNEDKLEVSLKLLSSTDLPRGSKIFTKPPKGRSKTSYQAKRRIQGTFGFSPLDPQYTFDQFVVGNLNQLAWHAANAISAAPGQRAYNPLFIYGNVGMGKTHLMQAIGHRLQQNFENAKVGYVRSSSFVQHLVQLLTSRDHSLIEQFKATYRSLDVLLIDDVHLFAGANASQEEFFHTFNVLLDGQKQIVITSDRFFKELQGMEDRLTSRIGQGMTVKLSLPEFETRVAILETKAKMSNMHLPKEVSHFLADRLKKSVRELQGAVYRLSANQQAYRTELTIDFVKRKLFDLLESNSKPLDIPSIQREVARFYGIRVKDILSKARAKKIAKARHVAMALCCELTNISLTDIGVAFNRGHTTVMHARNRIANSIKDSQNDRHDYNTLLEILNG